MVSKGVLERVLVGVVLILGSLIILRVYRVLGILENLGVLGVLRALRVYLILLVLLILIVVVLSGSRIFRICNVHSILFIRFGSI